MRQYSEALPQASRKQAFLPALPLLYYPHSRGQFVLGRFGTRKVSGRRAVRAAWSAPLPKEKLDLFKYIESHFEACYAMLSISLDEGLELLSSGAPVMAHQCAVNSAEFLHCLAVKLLAALAAMEKHGRHFGTLPVVKPLETSFFRGKTAQGAAYWNNLLHKVLLSDRSRFFHKLQTLQGLVEEISQEFFESAEELVDGSTAHPAAGWKALECLHYDLNTCLRETIVLLKSFLCVLPDEELKPLRNRLDEAAQRVQLRAPAFSRIPT